jgi:NADP-dependent aldehyde dehydrogenase
VGAGAPAGTLELVEGREEGVALVQDARIRAVGFTGSLHGGRILFDLAVGRPDPIPFYGELGSTNPVVLTAGAARERSRELAGGLVASFTLGVGQFCTKPGIVLVPAGSTFAADLAGELAGAPGGVMLSDGIADAFRSGVDRLFTAPGVRVIGRGAAGSGETAIAFLTDAATAVASPELLDECFGPTTLVVEYESLADIDRVLETVGAALTGTIHAAADEDVAELASHVGDRVGRLLFGGWPTGVAVTWSQHHGGPWPATTNALHTSVGATAIRRFLRPVVFQDAPEMVLPDELRDRPSLAIPRRIDGALTLD